MFMMATQYYVSTIHLQLKRTDINCDYRSLIFIFIYIEAALNLFINSNSQELLKEMKPDLRRKLVQVMTSFVEKLFAQVPYDAWIID